MLASKTVTELLDAFASPTPTPGGGSAAALAGAVAASLLAMVAAMPKTKNGTPEDRAALDAALPKLLALQKRLTSLIDRGRRVVRRRGRGLQAAEGHRRREGRPEGAPCRPRCVMRPTCRWKRSAPRLALIPLGARGRRARQSEREESTRPVASSMAMTAAGGAYANVEINLDGTGDAAFAAETRLALKAELMERSQTAGADLCGARLEGTRAAAQLSLPSALAAPEPASRRHWMSPNDAARREIDEERLALHVAWPAQNPRSGCLRSCRGCRPS